MLPVDVMYTREVVLGVRSYCRSHGPWELRIIRRRDMLADTLARDADESDGLIGVLGFDFLEQSVLDSKLPAVNVSGQLDECRLPSVLPDDKAIAGLAVAHFLARGFRRFAYVGAVEFAYAKQRRDAFVAGLRAAGFGCLCHDVADGVSTPWMQSLAVPTAVLASNDVVAHQVVNACSRAGLDVPADLAVLGVDNDALECELSAVPLSSIDTDAQRVGWEAASLLDRLMRGRRAPRRPVLVAPRNVVARDSTNTLAVEDPDVAYALSYIKAHACDPMNVSDIMDELTISRRTLEKRFRKAMGHSLHDEVRRVKFARAQALLVDSDLLVPGVARRCGFNDPKRFTTLFRVRFGIPPAAYRRKMRAV